MHLSPATAISAFWPNKSI